MGLGLGVRFRSGSGHIHICICMCTYRHVARVHEEARREDAHEGRVRGVVGREAQLEEHLG